MIALNHVTKKYGDAAILEDVTYTFPKHGLVCLLGPSGGGKTTLLNLLAGFDTDYEGEISIGGVSITGMDADTLCAYRRDHVGFIFQNYHLLFGYTALENVLLAAELSLGSRTQSRQKAESLLDKLGLGEKKHQRCETLSGGQKQRVAIARALLRGPQILFADEPTGALDRKTSGEIMELLKEIAQEKLVVVITHDPKLLPFADEVLRIEDRKLVSETTELHIAYDGPALTTGAGGTVQLMKRATKNFKVHLKRYLAVAAALAVGLTAFLASLSFGNVMERSIADFQERNTAFNNGYIKGPDDGTVRNILQEDQRIENVYYQYKLQNVALTLDGRVETLAEKLPLPKATESLSYGVMPRRGADEIALSPSLAKKFASDIQTLPGKTLTLTLGGKDYALTVSGIYNAGYDDFFVSSDVERQFYAGMEGEENDSISYDVKEFDDIVAVSNRLQLHKISSQNVSKEVFTLQETFRSLQRLFLIVSALVPLLALFLCTVLLVRLQNARYHEVGLLSALGFRRRETGAMIQAENLLLACLTAAMSAGLLGAAALVCGAAGFPLSVGAAQLAVCIAAAFISILNISGAASWKLLRTEPATALRK